MEDLPAIRLANESIKRLTRTISTNAFWMLVMDRVLRGQSLSVVRMSDGESRFLRSYDQIKPATPIEDIKGTIGEGYEALGMAGVMREVMRARIYSAAENTEFFAPSVSGYYMHLFDLSPWLNHSKLVDNYFVNAWTEPMINQLLRRAQGVMVLGRYKPRAGYRHVHMHDWRDCDRALEEALGHPEQLALVAAGSAGKHIIPKLATGGKVVLDIGQTMWRFAPG